MIKAIYFILDLFQINNMYFKIKVNRPIVTENDKYKQVTEYYLTEAENFADAGYKLIHQLGTEVEVEDVCMEKNLKPAVNEYMNNKIFIVKIAEDVYADGLWKTIKYAMPVFATNSDEVHDIMKEFIKQGFENMRLTTISETKWYYI